MRILYITLENVSLQKGSVVHIRETINGLRGRGHRIDLMARASAPFEGGDAFHNLTLKLGPRPIGRFVEKWASRHSMFLALFTLLFSLMRKMPKYDVVYARDYHAAAIALLPALVYRKKVVFEINGLASEEVMLHGRSVLRRLLGKIIKKGEHFASRGSCRVIAVTPQIASYLVSQYRCQPRRVHVVSNGVNLDLFHPVQDPAKLACVRRDLKIEAEDKVVIFVGNLAPWQGVEFLVRAAPDVIEAVRDVKFLIVGDGVLRGSIEDEVKRKGISERFVLTGMVEYPRIPMYINIADVCVLLKRKLASGFSPLKVYEYMACGKPVLASRVEGLEFIEKEGVGRLVSTDVPGETARTLTEMVTHDEARVGMGHRGRRLATEKFSWESKVIEIERILETLE
jgi:glycosyltransferase involved in cell wall biosynthesis